MRKNIFKNTNEVHYCVNCEYFEQYYFKCNNGFVRATYGRCCKIKNSKTVKNPMIQPVGECCKYFKTKKMLDILSFLKMLK